MVHGGLDYATQLLIDAFGKQRAEDLLVAGAALAGGSARAIWRSCSGSIPQQLGKFLDTEHPQTVALVLAHLDPRRASMVLDNLSEEHKVVSIRGWRRCASFLRRWRRKWL